LPPFNGRPFNSKKVNSMTVIKIKSIESLLTKREEQILKLICQEKNNSKIAEKLGITASGVDFHRRIMYKKTKSKTIVGLIKYAIRTKVLKL
jgi:DNA-binding CsgD family transcriptional regulator